MKRHLWQLVVLATALSFLPSLFLPGGVRTATTDIALMPSHFPFHFPVETLSTPPGTSEPGLDEEKGRAAWTLVKKYAVRYNIAHQARDMYRVLFAESRFLFDVRSPDERYLGIAQFTPTTFHANVNLMKELKLLPEGQAFSPFDPEHAIHVMAWMWSRGYQSHWGPARWLSDLTIPSHVGDRSEPEKNG